MTGLQAICPGHFQQGVAVCLCVVAPGVGRQRVPGVVLRILVDRHFRELREIYRRDYVPLAFKAGGVDEVDRREAEFMRDFRHPCGECRFGARNTFG